MDKELASVFCLLGGTIILPSALFLCIKKLRRKNKTAALVGTPLVTPPTGTPMGKSPITNDPQMKTAIAEVGGGTMVDDDLRSKTNAETDRKAKEEQKAKEPAKAKSQKVQNTKTCESTVLRSFTAKESVKASKKAHQTSKKANADGDKNGAKSDLKELAAENLADIRPNPVSPLRDRVSVLEAMGGRRTATPMYLAISLAFFLFISGTIMLGIGITKTVESSCTDNQKSEKLESQPQIIHCSQRETSFNADYHPCNNGDIILAFDNSNALSNDFFYQEINFLITMLFDDNWNHVERLTLIEYNNQSAVYSFYVNQTIDDVREVLGDAPPSRNPPKLIEVLKTVNDLYMVPSIPTSHLIIFVSFIDQNVVDECNSTAQTLSSKNITITFVSLGDQLNKSLFFQLSPYLIVWELSQKAPDQWNTEFNSAYGCESVDTNQQSASDPRLCRLFATIDHEDLVSSYAPAHALIFVSAITSSDVDNCRNYVLDLQNKGLTITFVTLGKNVNSKLLLQLSPNLIKWTIETDQKPALWNQLFWSAYGCAGNSPLSSYFHS
ncbi:hypothetical protein M3Y96_00374100 [Aphelenchoides besseyi]|nr:hypothetical protein M3Y96_00374100 [Aphelenchoides besseyi]